jgi:hypothetical protein
MLDVVPAPRLPWRTGTLSKGQGIKVGDRRDESQEFGQPRIFI